MTAQNAYRATAENYFPTDIINSAYASV